MKLGEYLGTDWQQQEKGLQVHRYMEAKKEMLKRHVEDFDTKCQAFYES